MPDNEQPAPAIPEAKEIGPAPTWVMVLGSIFAGITLIAFIVVAILAGSAPQFVCNSFNALAAVFAFGAALAATFIGGAAAVQGHLGSTAKGWSLSFSALGGIGVLFIAFFAFHQFKDDVCKIATMEKTIREKTSQVTALTTQLSDLKQQIRIVVKTNPQVEKLKEIEVRYIRKEDGELTPVIGKGNVFTIDRDKLWAVDPEIRIRYVEGLLPAQCNGRQPPVIVESLKHDFDQSSLTFVIRLVRVCASEETQS